MCCVSEVECTLLEFIEDMEFCWRRWYLVIEMVAFGLGLENGCCSRSVVVVLAGKVEAVVELGCKNMRIGEVACDFLEVSATRPCRFEQHGLGYVRILSAHCMLSKISSTCCDCS